MSVTNRPIRILFVCHGNICRSPMAEFIFKDMVRQVGLADQFEIASAATSREEIWHGKGNPVYPPAKAELAAHGLSCDGKCARQLTVADYDYTICCWPWMAAMCVICTVCWAATRSIRSKSCWTMPTAAMWPTLGTAGISPAPTRISPPAAAPCSPPLQPNKKAPRHKGNRLCTGVFLSAYLSNDGLVI